jgi:hypothetical protein
MRELFYLDYPEKWTTRWDILGHVDPPPEPILLAPPMDPSLCTGEGHCHGPLKWCDYCGDVSDVCDVEWPHQCDCHERYPEKPRHLCEPEGQEWLPGLEPPPSPEPDILMITLWG